MVHSEEVMELREEYETIHICEFCKKKFSIYKNAEDCEKRHEEDKDELYSKEMLKRAASHPGQLRLGDLK